MTVVMNHDQGLYPRDRRHDVSRCSYEYLDYSAAELAQAAPMVDPERLAALEHFQSQWVDAIRTLDEAQSMMDKLRGKQNARPIRYI